MEKYTCRVSSWDDIYQSINLSINQLYLCSANIPGEPGAVVRQAKAVFNSKIYQAVS